MHGDIRDAPAYGISEAARFIRIPRATLAYWTGDPNPLIGLPPSGEGLSFNNLVEAHVLRALRNVHGARMANVRSALLYAEEQLGISRLLLHDELLTSGGELFLDHLDQLINLWRSGQLALRKLLEDCLDRVERDEQRLPFRLYPVLPRESANERAISIDPRVSFGRPILSGSGVSTRALVDRIDAGEGMAEVARDYDLTEIRIQDAVLYEAAA